MARYGWEASVFVPGAEAPLRTYGPFRTREEADRFISHEKEYAVAMGWAPYSWAISDDVVRQKGGAA